MNKIWQIIDLLNWGEQYFTQHNIEQPRLNIESLLAFLLNKKRLEIYLNFEEIVTQETLNQLKLLIRRRVQGEPLLYIIGETEFFNCKINLNRSVLIPRAETEHMVDVIIAKLKQEKPDMHIADFGTGSGCIAIAIAKHFPLFTIDAIDISQSAIELAKLNAQKNQIESSINFICQDMTLFIPEKKYDLIVSNPPYIKYQQFESLPESVKNFEPKHALTDQKDGTKYLKFIISTLHKILRSNGLCFLEFGFDMGEWIGNFAESYQLNYKIYKDIHQHDRFIEIRLN